LALPFIHLDTGQFSRTGKPSTDSVIHPNVFIQAFPAQGQTTQTKRNFFEKVLRRVGKQWVFLTPLPSASSRQTRRPSIQQRTAAASVMISTAMPFNIAFNQVLAMLFHGNLILLH
jgi:hypothetical protein